MDSMLEQKMNPSEYSSYSPVIDELAYYATDCLQEAEYIPKDQTRTLLMFASTFDINDRLYWRQLIERIPESMNEMNSQQLIECLSVLKQFGQVQNSNVMKTAIDKLKKEVKGLTPFELVAFVMIYFSKEAEDVYVADPSFETNLEAILTKHEFTPTEFASICNAISFSDDAQLITEDNNRLTDFLNYSKPKALEWIN